MKKLITWKVFTSLLILGLIVLGCAPAYMTKGFTGIRRTVKLKPVDEDAIKARPPGKLIVIFEPPYLITDEIISTHFFLDGKPVQLSGQDPKQRVRELVLKDIPPGEHQLLLKNWTYKYETTRKKVTVESGEETEVVIKPEPTGARRLLWLPGVFAILGECLWLIVAVTSMP